MSAAKQIPISQETTGGTFETCPGCGAGGLDPKWVVNRFPIVACGNCSLVFVHEKISSEALKKHYETVHDDVYDEDNTDCLAFYYGALRTAIERRLPNKGRILDVGCAGGWFLDIMQGWECHGCELSPRDFEKAHDKHGDRIKPCSFEEFPYTSGSFDVIAMQDVFDHLPDPATALQTCFDMLAPGGLLVIKVHDISCLYAKVSGAGFYALIPPSHLFYYSRKSLTTMLAKRGFRVIQSRHIGHILKIKTIFYRLSRGDTKSLHYKIFRRLNRSPIGDLRFYKNLHDIITVFAVKG